MPFHAAGHWTTSPVPQKVYVVDDDAAHLRAFARLLRVSGFDVETFASAEDFLDRTNPRAANCLVLDIHLGGMSGIELAHRLMEDRVLLPIIFVTGERSDGLEQDAQNAGGAAYLQKPVSAKVLMETITRVCGSL
jgi:FixJ family two-component response regulator